MTIAKLINSSMILTFLSTRTHFHFLMSTYQVYIARLFSSLILTVSIYISVTVSVTVSVSIHPSINLFIYLPVSQSLSLSLSLSPTQTHTYTFILYLSLRFHLSHVIHSLTHLLTHHQCPWALMLTCSRSWPPPLL